MLKILLPTDFSKNAQRTADYFSQWFRPDAVEITLFNAIVPPRSSGGAFINIQSQLSQIAQQEMDKEVKRLSGVTQAKVDGICRIGYLEDTLDVAFKTLKADMAIMCTKGESNLASRLFGSNAEHCLRKLSYPVWVVPTQLPNDISHFVYSAAHQYLEGKSFLERFLSASASEDLHLEKLCIIQDMDSYNKEDNIDRSEDFMEKKVPLNRFATSRLQ